MRVRDLQKLLDDLVAADPAIGDLAVCTYDDVTIYETLPSRSRVLDPGHRAGDCPAIRSDRVLLIG